MEKQLENLKMETDTARHSIAKIQERIAVIEERQKAGEKDRDQLKSDNKEQKDLIVKIDTKLDGINEQFTLMKGKLGGILWLITSLGTAIALFGDSIMKWLKSF